jgi:hypothetical protein
MLPRMRSPHIDSCPRQERTNTEYGQLLAAAGLNLARVQPVAAPYGIIEGHPA